MGVISNLATRVAWIECDAKNGRRSAPEERREVLRARRGNSAGDHVSLTAQDRQ